MTNIVFVSSNYYYPFSHKTPKLGGSETMMCSIALQMRKYFDKVIVFNHRFENETIDKIDYKPEQSFKKFIKHNKIDILIVFRDGHFSKMVSNNRNVKKYFIWCQDFKVRFDEPVMGRNFAGFILLSDFHTDFFKKHYKLDDNVKVFKCPNHIDYNYILKFRSQKIVNSFIYTSMFNRGAETLLTLWPTFLRHYPNATLSLCCDVPEEWINFCNHKSIVHTGRLPKDELYSKLWSSQYWIYTSTFPETYCISALEAQACECICIHNGLAALSETIQTNQIIISEKLFEDINTHLVQIDYDYLWSRDCNVVGKMFKNILI